MDLFTLNEMGARASDADAHAEKDGANKASVLDAGQVVKRERRNVIRRIRRAIRKDHMDLHYLAGEYYPVPVHSYLAINVEEFGRRVGAIRPIGRCVCSGAAWHQVEGVDLCDRCAEEVAP